MTEKYAYVLSFADSQDIKLSFFCDGKCFEFNRPKIDVVEKTLQRISIKLNPKSNKKKKQKKENPTNVESLFIVEIFDDKNLLLCSNINNEEALSNNNKLKINDIEYLIKKNLPTVEHLVLPDSIMSGFALYPDVKISFGSIEYSKFMWYKSQPELSEWSLLCEEFTYTPTNVDISCLLKCICLPGNISTKSPLSEETISVVPVTANPGVCLFDSRHLYTPGHLNAPDEFRIVTYNVLADVFADSEFARTTLYPYCPPYALNYKYRMQLLLKEITGFHSDIIALQECEKKMYDKYFKPVLLQYNYSGILNVKPGEMPEGEALFYNLDKFEHIKDLSLPIKEMLCLECNKYILEKLKGVPSLCEKVLKKSALGQVQILRYLATKKLVCVVNTHLYYKPCYNDIRLIQMASLINFVNEELKVVNEEITVMVLGDFNSCVGDTLLDYLNGIEIKSDHRIWKINTDHIDLDLNLVCPLKLSNFTGTPPFTNYVKHFQNTLDYIFTQDEKLELKKFVPLPEEEEIKIYTALPSIVSPSDHLPLIIDVKWK